MLNEARKTLLARYHLGMARRRSAASLVRGAAEFCSREKIGFNDSRDFEEMYAAHYRRVRGLGSPADCDKTYDRLLRGTT
jgi:hypothetical protein